MSTISIDTFLITAEQGVLTVHDTRKNATVCLRPMILAGSLKFSTALPGSAAIRRGSRYLT